MQLHIWDRYCWTIPPDDRSCEVVKADVLGVTGARCWERTLQRFTQNSRTERSFPVGQVWVVSNKKLRYTLYIDSKNHCRLEFTKKSSTSIGNILNIIEGIIRAQNAILFQIHLLSLCCNPCNFDAVIFWWDVYVIIERKTSHQCWKTTYWSFRNLHRTRIGETWRHKKVSNRQGMLSWCTLDRLPLIL